MSFKYIKALVPINLFNGALWLEEEDIVRIPVSIFNDAAVQEAIDNDEIVEVLAEDLPVDTVSPTFKLRGNWDPSNGQLPVGRRIGDSYFVNAQGIAPYDYLEPGMRVLFTTLNTFDIITGEGGGSGPGPSPIIWTYVDENFNISSGGHYIVDTSSAPVTGTLPATLTASFTASFKDAAGSFSSNSFFIARTGTSYTIVGDTAPLEIDIAYPVLSLAFDSTNNNVVI